VYVKPMQEQELQQSLKAETTAPSGSFANGCLRSDSLPALAVAAANACNSPTFLSANARVLQEKQSGAFAKAKKLSHLTPITVPKRAIGGEFTHSPSSGSPTPTDFSPMLLPKAEANLTLLISEHNKQQRLQQLQLQQQIQFQLEDPASLKPPFELTQVTVDSTTASPEQPVMKKPKLSKRGRKRLRETANAAAASGSGLSAGAQQLATVPAMGAVVGSRATSRRSSLGSVAVSVDTEAPATGGTVMRKGPWLPEEDEKLLELVGQFGAYDWSFIAEHIPGRVGKQCRERYFNHLAPDVRKEAWTDCEDDAIVHAHHVVGNKWTNIAKMLGNGRSPNSIKNRWHSSLKNRLSEHGGEATVMEVTGAASGCQCDCKKCDCSCKVACVAFGCQCCFAAHNVGSSETGENTPTVSAHTATDDEYASGSSISSSSSAPTPASASSSTPAPSSVVLSAPGSSS